MSDVRYSGLYWHVELQLDRLQVYVVRSVHRGPSRLLQPRSRILVDSTLHHQYFLGVHDCFLTALLARYVS